MQLNLYYCHEDDTKVDMLTSGVACVYVSVQFLLSLISPSLPSITLAHHIAQHCFMLPSKIQSRERPYDILSYQLYACHNLLFPENPFGSPVELVRCHFLCSTVHNQGIDRS